MVYLALEFSFLLKLSLINYNNVLLLMTNLYFLYLTMYIRDWFICVSEYKFIKLCYLCAHRPTSKWASTPENKKSHILILVGDFQGFENVTFYVENENHNKNS